MLIMIRSPNIEAFLSTIQDLQEPSPQILGESIRQILNWSSLAPAPEGDIEGMDPLPNSRSKSLEGAESPVPDPRREVFLLEEQVARTVAQLERRNREFESLEGEHQILSESVTRLQETNVRSLNALQLF